MFYERSRRFLSCFTFISDAITYELRKRGQILVCLKLINSINFYTKTNFGTVHKSSKRPLVDSSKDGSLLREPMQLENEGKLDLRLANKVLKCGMV